MDYKHVLSIIDNESEKFDSVITKTEKAMLSAAVNAIKKLDVDASGNIRTTTANIKLLATIRTKLATVASNKEFMSGVKSVANAMDKLYKAQVEYYSKAFPQKTLGENAKKKHQALQQIAISNVASGLSQSALTASVVEPLNKMLLRAVTSGAKYADLIDEFHKQLESSDDSTSALAKYAKTYATTAMTQLAGENNRLFTDDLGAEWFQYVGSVIETSRQFCELLTEKEYIHKSEIKDILNGYIEIDGKVHECEMNPKTGLPKGLIEGTTEQNFQVNVGGWNCRHQLIPIAAEMVPAHIRAKFKKDLSVKEKAEIRHNKRTQEQVKDIQSRWEARKKKNALIKNSASNVLKVAQDYGEVDYSLLQKYIEAGDLIGMQNATKAIARKVSEVKKQETALASLIPNAHTLHKTYSMSELQGAYNELDGVIKKWLSKYSYSSLDTAPLGHLKNKLDFELTNPSIRYTHKNIIKSAISDKIRTIDKQIEWNDLISKATTLKSFETDSTVFKDCITDIDDAIKKNDFSALKKSIVNAEQQQLKLIEEQLKQGGNTALNKEYKGGVTGTDITSSVDTKKMTSEDPYRGTFTNNVARMQGFDAPAKLVSEAEFDKLVKISGDVFYRTVSPTTFNGKDMSSKEFASQLYKAELLELNGPGGRVHGDGMYVASSTWNGRKLQALTDSSKKEAYDESISYGKGNYTISEMTWTRKPKLITATKLKALWYKLTPEQQAKFGDHINTYGVALGYDGMYCNGPNYIVIWNRSIIAVKKQ